MEINDCIISSRLRDNGIPAYRLSPRSNWYRKKILQYIADGSITLTAQVDCLCGSDSFVKISEKERFGFPFSGLLCERCGLVTLSPKISEASAPKYYKEIYYPLITAMSQGTVLDDLVIKNHGKDIFYFIKDYLNKSIIKVCEIGCAGGKILAVFSEVASSYGIKCELYGCEYEEHYASHARAGGMQVSTGGIETLAEHRNQFDAVILSHVLEHLFDLRKELNAIKNLLCDSGLLYIEVPGVLNLNSYHYNNDLALYLVHAHNYLFSLTSLENVLALNGFSLIRGNEMIQAIFKKGDSRSLNQDIKCNSDKVLRYLKETEVSFIKGLTLLSRFKRFLWMSFYFLEYHLFLKRYTKKIRSLNYAQMRG